MISSLGKIYGLTAGTGWSSWTERADVSGPLTVDGRGVTHSLLNFRTNTQRATYILHTKREFVKSHVHILLSEPRFTINYKFITK